MLWRSVALPGSAPHWGCGGRGFKSRRSDHHVEKAALACRRGGFSCIRPARLPFPKAVERENSMATAFFFISKIGWLLVKPLNCLGLCLLAWLGCRRQTGRASCRERGCRYG